MNEIKEKVLERILNNTREIIKILDRMNKDTEKVLEKKKTKK